jgi:hypothetical protein
MAVRGELAAPPSARCWASAASARWRWRHDLPGQRPPGWDHDQFPVRCTDCEGASVRPLEDAEDVGDHLTVTWNGPAPADHDPLADIGGRKPDL